jgi:hypothetical protein
VVAVAIGACGGKPYAQHTESARTPVTSAAPAGYTIYSNDAGIAIAVPVSWVVADLHRHSLKQWASDLESRDPTVADYLSSSNFDHDFGLPYTDAFIVNPVLTDPTPDNLRIEHFVQHGNPVDDQQGVRAMALQMGLKQIEVSESTIAGHAAVVLRASL